MSELASVGPEIVRLAVFLNSYLGLISSFSNSEDSEDEQWRNLIRDTIGRVQRHSDRCGISVKLPSSFKANEDINPYLMSLPSGLFRSIADQLFKKHGRPAEALFDFVLGVFALMKLESTDADERDKVTAETLSLGQQMKLPESVIKDCLENGSGGLQRLESFLTNDSAPRAETAQSIQGRSPEASMKSPSHFERGSGMALMDRIKGHIIFVVIVVAVTSGGVVFSVVSWLNAERRRIMIEQNDLQDSTFEKKITTLEEQLAALKSP